MYLMPLLAMLAGVSLVVAGIYVFRIVRSRRSTSRKIQRLVHSVSADALTDVVIPDSLNGEVHIDHVLLTSRGLLLIDFNDVEGNVFAGDNLDQWIVIKSHKRLEFNNPLPRLATRVEALAALAPGVAIDARAVFVGDVAFPKGQPDRVATLDALHDEYHEASSDIGTEPNSHLAQWDVVKAAVH